MINTKQKAFTLVELIVVVTILAILATIGFVSYSSYLTGVRDTNRIAQMTSLSDGLNLYSTANNLPIPEENVEVTIGTNLIGYQGYAGANILETINFTKGGLDPKDNTYFSYYLTRDRRFFQLMGFLEESADLTTSKNQKSSPLSRGTEGDIFVNKTYAVNLEDRIPTVSGKKLGILTTAENEPIQNLNENVDLSAAATSTYIARLSNDDTVTGDSLLSINPKASCKRLKQMNGRVQSGTYKINPTGDNEIEVYCDMETDGGGWTFFMFVNEDTAGDDFFETPTGTYENSRNDTGSVYSISADIFSHTEMMVTLDDPSPEIAEENDKIAFYNYENGRDSFNTGPAPCVGLSDGFNYKTEINGSYVSGGTTNSCGTHWYSRTAGDSSYLVLFHGSSSSGNYWGIGMGGNDSWNHDGWWYLR